MSEVESVFPERSLTGTNGLRVITSPRDTVCTYTFLKTNFVEQEFFRCRDCFRGPSSDNLGVCSTCRRLCHNNHDTYSIGWTGAYCDCGLQACSINCRAGNKCTYDYYGKKPKLQQWYKCYTCWGGDSVFGCCEECAKGCHSGHDLVSERSSMICNCGHNGHRSAVCTKYTTEKNYRKQPFYHCRTCFIDPNEGCCYQCMKNCHSGHRVQYRGIINAFCDCGLSVLATTCKIATPSKD